MPCCKTSSGFVLFFQICSVIICFDLLFSMAWLPAHYGYNIYALIVTWFYPLMVPIVIAHAWNLENFVLLIINTILIFILICLAIPLCFTSVEGLVLGLVLAIPLFLYLIILIVVISQYDRGLFSRFSFCSTQPLSWSNNDEEIIEIEMSDTSEEFSDADSTLIENYSAYKKAILAMRIITPFYFPLIGIVGIEYAFVLSDIPYRSIFLTWWMVSALPFSICQIIVTFRLGRVRLLKFWFGLSLAFAIATIGLLIGLVTRSVESFAWALIPFAGINIAWAIMAKCLTNMKPHFVPNYCVCDSTQPPF